MNQPRPKPNAVKESFGIFSGDILIRNALIIGLQDLRDNPWQLPLVFSSLINDPYAFDKYGYKELNKAVNWFLKTEIPVVLDATLTNSPSMPIIIVGLQESIESEATLGDVHYVPNELVESEYEPLTQSFSAQYDPVTGLVIPSISVLVNNQMILKDKPGNKYPVLDIQSTESQENFFIAKTLNSDFSQCVLEWANNRVSVNLESLWFKETYNIVCNAKGEPYYALYLYAITKYALLRYKKNLLEGRGFEVSTISCSKLIPNTMSQTGSENIWCRVITITGKVKESWVSNSSDRITQSSFAQAGPDGLKACQLNFLPNSFSTDQSQEDPSYLSGDGIGVCLG